jgi:hypothetical protein
MGEDYGVSIGRVRCCTGLLLLLLQLLLLL